MSEFETPEPISAVVDAYVGNVRIVASERTTTVVDVQPGNRSRQHDVDAAEQTQVDFTAGQLRVKAPRPPLWKQAITRSHGSIDILIEVPTGSRIQADTEMGAIRTQGTLGDCVFKSSLGDIQVDAGGALQLSTSMGAIAVEKAHGRLEVSTASGNVRIGRVDGSAEVKSSNGTIQVDVATGELRVKSANGDINLGTTESGVTAKTAAGSVRVGEVVRGSVSLETSVGQVEIGIRRGTAALLDLNTKFGSVRNELESTAGPESTDEKAEVRGRTSAGDIIVRRSA